MGSEGTEPSAPIMFQDECADLLLDITWLVVLSVATVVVIETYLAVTVGAALSAGQV